MRRKTMKVSSILLYYSLAVTACLILVFIIFIRSISIPEQNLPKYLFVVNEKNIVTFIQSGNLGIPFNGMYTSVINRTSLENYYTGAMLKNIPFLIICLVVMLVVGIFVLSRIFKKQDENQALLLAKQLSSIDEENLLTEQHPAVVEAYRKIREKFEAYGLDYVRLGTYVTHEQKNILSLLRAKLQLSDNASLTEEVDRVTDSLDDILTLSA